jgi:hypothetical protein
MIASTAGIRGGAFNTGDTVDGISVAACLLDESTARLDDIDYSHLSAAPAGGTQGYVYVPGTPVAIWQ